MRPRVATARVEWAALAVLGAFTLLAVGGYWGFALNPGRIATTPGAASFYAISFKFFARVHIVLAAVALAVVLVRRTGLRWLPALAAVYVLSFTAEHVGTGWGVPFGGYGYTALLGWKLGGRVPALIPLSWFLMALPSWVLARRAVGGRGARIALGALWLVTWDLALDPAMSHLTPYWVWEHAGPYYGMPWINLAGWFVTGVALMAALDLLADRSALDRLPVGFMAGYWAAIVLMPLGMLVAAGAWLAVVVTLGGVLVASGLTALAARRAGAGRGARRLRSAAASTAPKHADDPPRPGRSSGPLPAIRTP